MLHHKGRSLCPGKALAHFAGIVRRKGALSVQLLVPIGTVPNSIVLFQMMLPAESFAHPVHPAPQQDGEHKVDRVLQSADQ